MKIEKSNNTDSTNSNQVDTPGPQTADTPVRLTLTDSPPEGFISKRELARRLRKSIRTISYWQRCGILPFVKCHRSVYYDWSAITAHLSRHFCHKQPQPPTQDQK